ncbi:MAG: DUF1573 domain-containing protein [Rubripirellula sp.]|nr:hypothetical protein [Rhodopirellula sp.]MCH1440225.1 DUF1573 domain-containing protein [Rubripirellula sp.]OUX06271.1 MAG: hypothetical protein CBE00_07975 [Planctomycetaceae bacterium TMED240]
MSPSSKRTLLLVGSLVAMITAASGVSLSVHYKPYGVPDVLRAEYEKKIADIKEREFIFQNADKLNEAIAYLPTNTHDFGIMDPHGTASHQFEIHNKGSAPLALKMGTTTCKCTAGKLGSSLLQPGEQTTIELTWNTGYKVDKYEQSAFLFTNDPTLPEIELKVKGEIKGELISPEKITFPQTNVAETTHTRFVICSQAWTNFEVENIECEAEDFAWYAEPIGQNDPRLADKHSAHAVEIHVFTTPLEKGRFSGNMELRVRSQDGTKTVVRTVAYSAKTRSPISFYSRDIHFQDGLDIGTLTNNKSHQFNLVVRTNGDTSRKIEVLDVEPKIINATLTPLKTPGNFRLSLKIPLNSPTTIFNMAEKHGYVQVGDPADKNQFSNWFPIHGAVVELSK